MQNKNEQRKPVAVLTGITGAIGSYLSELLLEKGFEIHGLIRRSSNFNTQRIDHIYDKIHLHYGDLSDYASIVEFVQATKPDYFFNLGAQSFVKASFSVPLYTLDVTGGGVVRCLEAIRIFSPHTKFVTASSSEMFGAAPPPQNETTPFQPMSVYATAKAVGYYSVIQYRKAFGLNASNAIMFNNESERRGEVFVTRKISRGLSRCALGLQKELRLGNINAYRDWSHSLNIVDALYLIAMEEEPDDYCIASGESHCVEEFLDLAAAKLNINWRDYVVIDPKYFRPSEVDHLRGDASKIRNKLGWKPTIGFEELVDRMVDHDLQLAQNELLLKESK